MKLKISSQPSSLVEAVLTEALHWHDKAAAMEDREAAEVVESAADRIGSMQHAAETVVESDDADAALRFDAVRNTLHDVLLAVLDGDTAGARVLLRRVSVEQRALSYAVDLARTRQRAAAREQREADQAARAEADRKRDAAWQERRAESEAEDQKLIAEAIETATDTLVAKLLGAFRPGRKTS